MNIGVIGVGNVGGALGTLWAKRGHEVLFGVRDPQDAKLHELAKSSDGKARIGGVKDAAAFGEAVVLATP
jgi:8-hydroxy-5-deazaflavin:NADPH oxidoreductase